MSDSRAMNRIEAAAQKEIPGFVWEIWPKGIARLTFPERNLIFFAPWHAIKEHAADPLND